MSQMNKNIQNACFHEAAAGLIAFVLASAAFAQSTYGTFVGTVRDPSGSVVADCAVTLENTGTGLIRMTRTNQAGSYEFVNVDAGTYKITMQSSGFQEAVYQDLLLQARQTIRMDGSLILGTQAQSVVVESAAPVIATDVSNLSVTQTGRALNDLPVAIASRASGSTSPFQTLTMQTGVQSDASGNISIAGAKPALISYSLDGISNADTRGVNGAAPILKELFPSFSSIAEIRVSEVNNSAEFSGASDVTTISRGGTNAVHGGFFENLQNTDFNARNTFSATVPKEIMNDFGVSIGGPLVLPHLYNGRNKTFFFATYEGLRLDKQTVLVESVPSLALRQGNLSYYSKYRTERVTHFQAIKFQPV
jgi:Carboxypeptidase regulatory-like domain